MAIICDTVTSYIVKDILVPTEKWENQLEKQCKQLPWWNPLKWLCWFVVVLVKVVVWVTQHVTVPIVKSICVVVSGFVGTILLPFAAAYDAVFQTNCYQQILACYITPTAIEFVSSVPSATEPGQMDYTFKCNCSDPAKSQQAQVTAFNDDQAAALVKEKCAKTCA